MMIVVLYTVDGLIFQWAANGGSNRKLLTTPWSGTVSFGTNSLFPHLHSSYRVGHWFLICRTDISIMKGAKKMATGCWLDHNNHKERHKDIMVTPQSSILNNSTISTHLQHHSHNCFSVSTSMVYQPPSTRLKKWCVPCQHSITTQHQGGVKKVKVNAPLIYWIVHQLPRYIHDSFIVLFPLYSWRWTSSHNLTVPSVASSSPSMPLPSPKYHVGVEKAKLR